MITFIGAYSIVFIPFLCVVYYSFGILLSKPFFLTTQNDCKQLWKDTFYQRFVDQILHLLTSIEIILIDNNIDKLFRFQLLGLAPIILECFACVPIFKSLV